MQKKHRKKPDLWAKNRLTPSISHRGLEPPTVCWPSPATWVRPNFRNPPQDITCMAHNQVSIPICVCLLSVWRNEMAKAMTIRARDSKYATLRDWRQFFTLIQPTSHYINKGARSSGRVRGSRTLEGHRRSTRLWGEPSAFITSHLFIFLLSG